MNDRVAVRRTPPQVFSAKELAAMPTAQARAALVAQECAHMQQHHAKRILKEEVGDLDLNFDVGRIVCIGIEGQRFMWEAHEDCGLCGNTGEIIGADSKSYDCPVCESLVVEIFSTDYDGDDIRVDA